jgi:hypothetical protein
MGDVVNSGTIEEINPLSVVIKHGDKNLIVRLFQNQVVKDYKYRNETKNRENHEQ